MVFFDYEQDSAIASFDLDRITGRLNFRGRISSIPAGQSSNRLAAFRINRKTGALTRFATYEVGKQTWWVHVV